MEKRSAIVTGGAGGIGLATVDRLLKRGMSVLLVDSNEAEARKAEQRFASDRLAICVADVMDPLAVVASAEGAHAQFGRVDVLVNVVGGAGPTKAHEIESVGLDTWDLVMALNVRSAFLFCRAVIPYMRRQRYGRIVNLSSVLARGEKGPPTTVAARLPYATAKAALLGFTSPLAKDVASDGITVNALLPGLILGEDGTRIRSRFEALDDEARARMVSGYPVGRPGEADEVAAAIEFLTSEAAGYITGTALPIDGGYLN